MLDKWLKRLRRDDPGKTATPPEQDTALTERVIAMLRMLGYAEVQSILQEQGAIDVHCEFCNKQYKYDSVDAEQLFAAESGAPAWLSRQAW